jgi:hypothetical protein
VTIAIRDAGLHAPAISARVKLAPVESRKGQSSSTYDAIRHNGREDAGSGRGVARPES